MTTIFHCHRESLANKSFLACSNQRLYFHWIYFLISQNEYVLKFICCCGVMFLSSSPRCSKYSRNRCLGLWKLLSTCNRRLHQIVLNLLLIQIFSLMFFCFSTELKKLKGLFRTSLVIYWLFISNFRVTQAFTSLLLVGLLGICDMWLNTCCF